MINLRELRLNNWVYSLQIGEYVQISSIDSEFVTLKDHVTWDYVYADMIEPIPLTEEILLKCGFEKGLKYFSYKMANANIKHLHQLQNLYFALTGEELKIEL